MAPIDRILQWNCHSITNKKSDLIFLINKHNPSILSVSETWLRPGSNFKLSRYVDVRSDRQDGFGGVGLFLKNNINFSYVTVPSHNSFDIVAVRVNNFTIVSIYIPSPTKSIISSVISIIKSLPKPLLVLGDFNCHHTVWGSELSNSTGSFLLDSLDNLNLCILNDGSPTRRTRPNESISAVDLSLCSPELVSLMSWCVLPSSHGSDHFPILLNIFHNSPPPPPSLYSPLLKYVISNSIANWDKFNKFTDINAMSLPPVKSSNVVSSSDILVHTLLACADLSFPLKRSSSKKIPSPPWWDKECSDAIKARKAAEANFSRSMTRENYSNLNKISAETKRLFRNKKRDSWKTFCGSISPITPPSLIWTKINRYRRSWSPIYHECCPTQSWADLFMDRIAPQYCPLPSELPSLSSSLSIEPLDLPFSLTELNHILSSVKDSAPGMDGIPYSFFSKANIRIHQYYLSLVNTVFDTGIVPVSWKSQFVIPILKPNKDSSDPSSYRPIALSSVLTKIAEHLIKCRLEWFLESNELLAKTQFGFRKGKSTMDSLAIFTTDIRLAFSRNESLIGAFLDISGAYDNVQLSLLRNKLHNLKVPPKLCNFVMNLMSERYICFRCNDPSISSKRVVWRGLPQGSVLSPLLYNIYTHDLESSVGFCRILQYADDILLYNSHHKIDIASNNISHSLQNLNLWLQNNGLDLSPSKSSIVLFSRKKKIPVLNIFVGENKIPVKDSVKFLGLVLDNKLSGNLHCEIIVNKCERYLNILRCLSGVWWGAHPYNLRLLYNAIIRSILDYGSFLLIPTNKSNIRKLDLIQSKSLRIITGAMKSSPINALQVECVDPPLHLRRQFLANRFFFRSVQFSNHPLIPKLQLLSQYSSTSRYWRCKQLPLLIKSYSTFKSLKDPTFRSPTLPIFQFNYNSIVYHPQIILNFDICKHDVSADEYFRELLRRDWHGWHTIFTDASKLSPVGCVGCAVFHFQYNIIQKIKCPPESSVFTGECLAILEAVNYILLFKLRRTIIFSDSRSSLQALLSNPFSSKFHPLLFQIKKSISDCTNKGLEVVLAWIPGHAGISGNIRADTAAKEAVSCGDKVPFINYCADLISLPKTLLLKSWSLNWISTSTVKGSSYARIQAVLPSKPWFSRWYFGKFFTSCLIRMRLRHCAIPVHLNKIHVSDTSLCECGLDEGDLNHIFFSCPLLNHSSFFHSLYSLKVSFPTHIDELLSSNNRLIYKSLVDFISYNNLKL